MLKGKLLYLKETQTLRIVTLWSGEETFHPLFPQYYLLRKNKRIGVMQDKNQKKKKNREREERERDRDRKRDRYI